MQHVKQLAIIYNYVIKNICLSYALSSQSALKTRKQNYIIIFTSLSGSFMLFRFLQKKFFQQFVENYVEKLLKLLKTIIVNPIYSNSKHNLHTISTIQTHQKYLNNPVQTDYTISHIPYHNI